MAEPSQALNPSLQFRPIPHGDPGPEIYRILVNVLERRQMLELANVLLEAEVKASQVHLQNLQAMQNFVGQHLK